jgi:phosphoribosylanthranilate isomerase
LRIKICGLFREEDIDYVNEARPDYCGFVFAPSKRQVSAELAARLRRRLAEAITPVGVFIDAPIADIVALYRDGVISIAQLHGGESEEYIARLKAESGDTPIPVIEVIKSESLKSLAQGHGGHEDLAQRHGGTGEHGKYKDLAQRHGDTGENGKRKAKKTTELHGGSINSKSEYYLLDSGAGSGKTFNWELLNSPQSLFDKPWFLAGGIDIDNIEKAMALKPFAIDVSSGAETDGVKDREKILRLTKIVREGNKG